MLGNDTESIALLNSFTTLRNYTRGLEDARELGEARYTEIYSQSSKRLNQVRKQIIKKIKEVRP